MAFENAAEHVGLLTEYSKQYVEERIIQAKLTIAEKSATLLAELSARLIAFALMILSLVFLLLSFAFVLKIWLGSMAIPLAIVGIIIMAASMTLFWLRKSWITNSILSFILEIILEEDEL